MKYFIIYIAWNVLVMFIYGIDKKKAEAGRWRIPEKTLIGLAAVFGGIGAYIGMHLFHHKTKKSLFKVGVPLCILLNIAEVAIIILII